VKRFIIETIIRSKNKNKPALGLNQVETPKLGILNKEKASPTDSLKVQTVKFQRRTTIQGFNELNSQLLGVPQQIFDQRRRDSGSPQTV